MTFKAFTLPAFSIDAFDVDIWNPEVTVGEVWEASEVRPDIWVKAGVQAVVWDQQVNSFDLAQYDQSQTPEGSS